MREASQLSADAAQLLAQLDAETESTSRRLDQLLAAEPAPPRVRTRSTSPSPPPLLAPRTPNWSLSSVPPLPPGDHPLKHMYRSPVKGGVKVGSGRAGSGVRQRLRMECSGRPRVSELYCEARLIFCYLVHG